MSESCSGNCASCASAGGCSSKKEDLISIDSPSNSLEVIDTSFSLIFSFNTILISLVAVEESEKLPLKISS
mgnify:CR=1 FL=1